MGRRLAGFVLAVCIALPMLGAPAGAVRAAHAPRFVGTYRYHDTTHQYVVEWRLDANGDVYQGRGADAAYFASWANDGRMITVTRPNPPYPTEYWYGQETRRGIGNRRNLGLFYVGSHPEASWYAVRLDTT